MVPLVMLLLQPPHKRLRQRRRWSNVFGEHCHSDDGEKERKGLQKLAVDLVISSRLDRDTKGQSASEQNTSGDSALQGPSAKYHRSDGDKATATDDALVEISDVNENQKSTT